MKSKSCGLSYVSRLLCFLDILVITVVSSLPHCGSDILPIDLSAEYHGDRSIRFQALSRGRAGNAIIQSAHVRMYAAEHGGSAAPWAQFGRMKPDGLEPEVWGPRFGAMAFCTIDPKDTSVIRSGASRCPQPSKIKYVPGALMSKGRCGEDSRFHQNYNYFRGRRDALRYYLATSDELEYPELQRWEAVMAPMKVWRPKRPPWLGDNDAVVHIRISHHPEEQLKFLCKNAANHKHLCSLRRNLIPDELFRNGTCQMHATTPPFEYYKNVLKERGKRQAAAEGKSYDPRKPGGWDNVWIVGESKVFSSPSVKRAVAELHLKKAPTSGGNKDIGPLLDIYTIKSANYIIQTYGTFSWIGALLSRAREIHKPYTTHNWANTWAEEAALFVDDQPEYIYHNVEEGRYFLSAEDVLAETNSPFVTTIHERAAYTLPPNQTWPTPVKCR